MGKEKEVGEFNFLHSKKKLSAPEMADFFGISVPTAYRWYKTGKFPGYAYPGGTIFFTLEDCESYKKKMEDDYEELKVRYANRPVDKRKKSRKRGTK